MNKISELLKRAKHYEEGQAPLMAARFYRMAGEQAAAGHDYDQARQHLTRALELTPDAQRSTRYALLLAREDIDRIQGNSEARSEDLAGLETLANYLDDNRYRAEIALRQARFNADTGDYRNAITIVQLALALAQLTQSDRLQATGYLIWGKTLLRSGDYPAAWVYLMKAQEIAEAANLLQVEADSLKALGILFEDKAEYLRATDFYQQAMIRYHQLEDLHGEGDILNNLGNVSRAYGRFTEAHTYWEQAQKRYHRLGNRTGQAMVLTNLGVMFMDLGQYDQAVTYHQEVRQICQQTNIPFGEGMALINLSLVQHYQGHNQQALDLSRQAITHAQAMANRRLHGYALTTNGHALTALAQLDEAKEVYWQSIALWSEMGIPSQAMEAQAGLARVALQQADPAQALNPVNEILDYLQKGNTLDGTESPFRIQLTCYQVLKANQDSRADKFLKSAQNQLLERAEGIIDPDQRQSFLEQVAAHQALMHA